MTPEIHFSNRWGNGSVRFLLPIPFIFAPPWRGCCNVITPSPLPGGAETTCLQNHPVINFEESFHHVEVPPLALLQGYYPEQAAADPPGDSQSVAVGGIGRA